MTAGFRSLVSSRRNGERSTRKPKMDQTCMLVKRHADMRSEYYARTQEILESEFVPSPLPLPRLGASVVLHYMSFLLTGQQKCKCRDSFTHGASDDSFSERKTSEGNRRAEQWTVLLKWTNPIQGPNRGSYRACEKVKTKGIRCFSRLFHFPVAVINSDRW